jgi:hypothetical protein
MEAGLLSVQLRAHYDKEAARIEAEATGKATEDMLSIELDVLALGIAKANGSAAGAKLVADRLEL